MQAPGSPPQPQDYNLRMFRRARRLSVVLILLVLLAAVVVPVVASGYADIRLGNEMTQKWGEPGMGKYYVYAAQKLPWMPELWERAASWYARGDCRDALNLFEIANARAVLSAQGWVLYGYCYEIEGQYQAAWDTWAEGLRHFPHEASFYYYFSLEDERKRDFAAELRDLGVWMKSGQASTSTRQKDYSHYRFGTLLMASSPDEARSEFQQTVALQPATADVVNTLNTSLALAGLEASPSRRLVIIGRGLGLVNEWPLAQYDFQQAVNGDPRNAEAWAWLGEAQQQNKQDGKDALDKALELDPNSSIVHGLRGLYWKRQGKPKAALSEYLAAAKLEPKNAEWQAALGDAYASTGDLVSALAAYVTATDLAPDNAQYWRLLALFSAENGVQVLDVGLPAAKKAAEIAPDDPQVLDALGWTYAQAGLLNTAEQTLNKAIKLAPEAALAHLHLAETYLRAGNASFAQSELNRVVQLDPEGPSGVFAAQLLKQYFP